MTEEQIHKSACLYISMQYPNVLFNSDMSGIKLPIGLAKKVKSMRSERGYPDLVIYESRQGYKALFIEIKKDGVKIRKKNGDLVSNEHIQEQHEVINKLNMRGYYASFAIGIDDVIKLIDWYLK